MKKKVLRERKAAEKNTLLALVAAEEATEVKPKKRSKKVKEEK